MIRLIDATILALTKLRTHKIRTAITIIIPSLLFGVLFAILIASEGTFYSISNFSKEGYSSRFMVNAVPIVFDDYSAFQNPDVIARAKEIYKETIAAKKAAAKEIGIIYEETFEENPVINYSGVSGEESLSMSAPSAIQAFKEYGSTQPKIDLDYLMAAAGPYNPIGYYSILTKTPKSGSISLMKDGKEDFLAKDSGKDSMGGYSDYNSIEAIISQSNGFTVMDHDLSDSFLLPKDDTTPTNSDAIPVIITYDAAELMLNLSKLDNKASQEERINRIKEIQNKASSISFSVCYRNTISQQLINETIATATEIERNKGNRDYFAPSVVYQLPADDSCAAPTIKSDTRSSEEKAMALKIKQFNNRFGVLSEPDQQKIEFSVVGLMPNGPDYSNQAITPASILQSLVGSSINYGLIVPKDLYDSLPSSARYETIFTKSEEIFTSQPDNFVVEFASSEDASKFISEKICMDMFEKCIEEDRSFWLYGYGSNSIALDSIKKSFLNIFSVAILVVAGIAVFIMTGTLGRMIADGRRETAVFRAIGFKRIDIASVYITYIIIISLFIVLTSFTIGATAAYILDATYWQEFTFQSLLAFGVSDMTREFHFFKLNYMVIAMVLGSVIGSGIISTIIPLARNIRRNPIKDMRDE